MHGGDGGGGGGGHHGGGGGFGGHHHGGGLGSNHHHGDQGGDAFVAYGAGRRGRGRRASVIIRIAFFTVWVAIFLFILLHH